MKIKEIELLNYGSLITYSDEKEVNKSSPTGYFLRPSKIEFVDATDKIEGQIGLTFGIEYFIKGYTTSKYSDVAFLCKILHPTLTNPETKEQFSETIDAKYNYLNDTNFDFLSFEYDWEVQKGTYTFQIIEKDTILLEKSFEII